MKKLLGISLLAFLLSTSLETYSQLAVGVRAGATFANMSSEDNDDVYDKDYSTVTGFHVGAVIESGTANGLGIQTGLNFVQKGFESSLANIKFKREINYLEIPLNLKASAGVGDLRIFGIAGPYLSMGLGGKQSSDIQGTQERDISFGSANDDDYKSLDYGASFGAGIELGALHFSAFYSLGIANIANNDSNGQTNKNKALNFSIALVFGD